MRAATVLGVLGCTLVTTSGMAQEPGEGAASGDSAAGWRFELAPYLWALGVEGDLGVRGTQVGVSASFVDIVEKSDSLFAFAGRAEVGYGKFAGFVDASYSSININDVTGPVGLNLVDVDFEQTVADFGVMYRVGDWEPKGSAAENPRNLTLDLYGGGRYTDIDLQITPDGMAERSGSESWVDPIFGVKAVAPFAEHWHVSGNADVGGFGVASDLTWSVTAVVGFDFHIARFPSSVYAGYRVMGWDYSTGSGADEFTWDVMEHGIILGFSMQF